MDWFSIKQNSTSPTLRLVLTDEDGVAVSLAGATAKFSMREQFALTYVISEAAATITGTGNNVVQYTFTLADTANTGRFLGEFVVTLSGGGILRVPQDGNIGVRIYAELGELTDESTTAYTTTDAADLYFDTHVSATAWDDATETEKVRALAHATRLIERLNFIGEKADPDQTLQFPRGTDTAIPEDVKAACCELALALLDETNLESEYSALLVEQTTHESTKTVYNRKAVPTHILAGIVSIEAWRYLIPYLRHISTVSLV